MRGGQHGGAAASAAGAPDDDSPPDSAPRLAAVKTQQQQQQQQQQQDDWRRPVQAPQLGLNAMMRPRSRHGSRSTAHSWAAAAADGSSRPGRLRRHFKGLGAVLRRHPGIWVASLLVTAALAAAGVSGVFAAARLEGRHRQDNAQALADTTAVSFQTHLQQMLAPLFALAAFVHVNPNYQQLVVDFPEIAKDLLGMPESNWIASLQLAPHGVVRSIYPFPGNEAAVGLDLLREPRHRPAALSAIEHRHPAVQGPLYLRQGFVGVLVRLPVFKANVSATEDFGAPGSAFQCPMCYDASTGSMFWGFVTALVNADAIANRTDARLQGLQSQGFNYELSAPQPDGSVFEVSDAPLGSRAPVIAPIQALNAKWRLRIAPVHGWVPSWRDPMLATAVVASVAMGVLVGAVMVNRRQLMWAIAELQSTNTELADEKARMDALLCRQISLINAMGRGAGAGGGGGRGGGGPGGRAAGHRVGTAVTAAGAVLSGVIVEKSSGDSSSGTGSATRSPHCYTLERIEDLRRNIGAASTSTAQELELLELLGEGSFGKVFRGTWRGSTVAIKTMVLPAHMSGAEKRERMLVMETAISSSLLHPNIVQTYTYTIAPTTNSYSTRSKPGSLSDNRSNSVARVKGTPSTPSRSLTTGLGGSQQHVYGYEVCLVLEYCDRGSLRDALDGDAFRNDDGSFNYAAILDTAADIARAMQHLHRQQARNVLLKSDSTDGRTVVAKVGDFGLAVPLDNLGTHVSEYQGTQTHMSPEAQLAARVSKAGDVYSFGITCWELFTAGHAFADIPTALLGHRVAVQGVRPKFPTAAPREFQQLVEACWAADPEKRPTFDAILLTLQAMRSRLGGRTLPLRAAAPRVPGDSSGGGGPDSAGPGGWQRGMGSATRAASAGSWGPGPGVWPQWAQLDTILDIPSAAADTPRGSAGGASGGAGSSGFGTGCGYDSRSQVGAGDGLLSLSILDGDLDPGLPPSECPGSGSGLDSGGGVAVTAAVAAARDKAADSRAAAGGGGGGRDTGSKQSFEGLGRMPVVSLALPDPPTPPPHDEEEGGGCISKGS